MQISVLFFFEFKNYFAAFCKMQTKLKLMK